MSFHEDLILGKLGEMVFTDFFNNMPDVKEVFDVRKDKKFQSFDVDYLLKWNNNQVYWVEVKTDFKTYDTGNIVYEVKTSGNLGCYEYTKAEIIAYYIPQSGIIYFISVKKLREYVKTESPKLLKISNDTDGYLLPIAELERQTVIVNEYQADKILSFDKT